MKSITQKFIDSAHLIKEDGVFAFIVYITHRYKLPVPLSPRFKWNTGIKSEIRFWDKWLLTKGLRWPESYKRKTDPFMELQTWVVELLPPAKNVDILDVGAGPLTVLGKICDGRRINIVAVDPLADEYDRLLEKHHIQPVVRTNKLDGEELTRKFPPNSFDLVYANNAIDHTYNPEKVILQMIEVVKKNRYILLEHSVNEAEHEEYSGFHQWNFSINVNGDFMISSKFWQVNMSQKYMEICKIECKLINNRTLVTTIQKK